MPLRKLKEFLDREKVKYVSIAHSPAYTAQEIAQTAHVPGREMAKTVMVKLNGAMAMVVLPADQQINFERLREETGKPEAKLADEHEFARLFPGCEVGAMPPFGNLWGLEVFVADTLARDEQIVFNAGTHTELIRLPFREFKRLAHPKTIHC
ncbi:MAG: aminoacyl-tRNA deacylase [Planctomycetota bacterium]|jgi:Ala-tRNA(Pro) deacylase